MRFWIAALAALLISSPAAARPNIVVIFTDDQDDTTSMTYMPKAHTLLAEEGITFKNSFVNYPLCAPSRASMFSGQAAHNHGVISNSPEDEDAWRAFRPQEAKALPVWLQKAGYKTALLGKYINGYGKMQLKDKQALKQQASKSALSRWVASLLGESEDINKATNRDWVPAGWDLWYAFAGAVRYFDYFINENGTLAKFGHRPEDYSTDVLKDRAVRFIEEQARAGDPFFLLIATKAVHGKQEKGKEERPATPAPKYENKFLDVALPMGPAFNKGRVPGKDGGVDKVVVEKEYRAVLQTLQSVDDLVEGVVGALQSAGILDNTIIIYTSDNGFLFGDHARRAKGALYEGAIRVPLIVRGPGVPKGVEREQLVNNLDVVATIVDTVGATPLLVPDGRSLRPLFSDASFPWRDALGIEKDNQVGLRTPSRKYIRGRDGRVEEELYDLVADPHELENLAGDARFASELASLRAKLDTLQNCAGANCWSP